MKKILWLSAMLLAMAGSPSWAGKLSAEAGWVRAVPPVSKNTAAYFTLNNQSKKDDVLLHLSSDVAAHTELHTIIIEPNGAKKMQPVPHANVKSKQQLKMAPGGYHVMLIGLKKPLKEGDQVRVDMIFQQAGKLSVNLPVKMAGEAESGKDAHHHHHH